MDTQSQSLLEQRLTTGNGDRSETAPVRPSVSVCSTQSDSTAAEPASSMETSEEEEDVMVVDDDDDVEELIVDDDDPGLAIIDPTSAHYRDPFKAKNFAELEDMLRERIRAVSKAFKIPMPSDPRLDSAVSAFKTFDAAAAAAAATTAAATEAYTAFYNSIMASTAGASAACQPQQQLEATAHSSPSTVSPVHAGTPPTCAASVGTVATATVPETTLPRPTPVQPSTSAPTLHRLSTPFRPRQLMLQQQRQMQQQHQQPTTSASAHALPTAVPPDLPQLVPMAAVGISPAAAAVACTLQMQQAWMAACMSSTALQQMAGVPYWRATENGMMVRNTPWLQHDPFMLARLYADIHEEDQREKAAAAAAAAAMQQARPADQQPQQQQSLNDQQPAQQPQPEEDEDVVVLDETIIVTVDSPPPPPQPAVITVGQPRTGSIPETAVWIEKKAAARARMMAGADTKEGAAAATTTTEAAATATPVMAKSDAAAAAATTTDAAKSDAPAAAAAPETPAAAEPDASPTAAPPAAAPAAQQSTRRPRKGKPAKNNYLSLPYWNGTGSSRSLDQSKSGSKKRRRSNK